MNAKQQDKNKIYFSNKKKISNNLLKRIKKYIYNFAAIISY